MSMTIGAAMIAATGCGSAVHAGSAASAGSHPSGGALSRVLLIEKADAICHRLNAQFAATEPKSQSIAESARIVPRRAIVEQRVVIELGGLTPPASLAHQLKQIIAYRRALAQELAELGLVAKHGDTAAFRRLAASKVQLHRELTAAAASAGLRECGRTG
jgi:hypothetical protein